MDSGFHHRQRSRRRQLGISHLDARKRDDRGRHPAGYRRHALPGGGQHRRRVSARRDVGHLCQRIRPRQLARQSDPRHDEQLERRTVDRVRPVRHGAVRPYARIRRLDHRRLADPRPARAADRDPDDRRGDALDRPTRCATAATRSARPNCRPSGAYCCRWLSRTSSPG